MSNFIEAMDVTHGQTPMLVGEKGTAEYSSQQVGEVLVALFFALVRNIPEERLVSLVNECLQQAKSHLQDAPRIVADLFLLSFQTRDCRGGKGERNLFYKLLLHLFEEYPATVLSLLPLIGEYGYYKDYFKILQEIGMASKYQVLKDRILDIVVNQLIADEGNLEKAKEQMAVKGEKGEEGDKEVKIRVSLCAKYAPREGHEFQKKNKEIFRELLGLLFPQMKAPVGSTTTVEKEFYNRAKKQYRLMITNLTAAIDVPEVKMCGKRYAEISFDHVPSVSMKKYRKAFANEALKTPMKLSEADTGNRHPTDPDRVACRQHLLAAIKGQKIKGKQNHPHEIAKILMGRGERSQTEIDIFQAQWDDIRNNIVQQIEETKKKAEEEGTGVGLGKGIDLGKLVPMVDVSGSMSGTPMQVAIALGILISELTHPVFRDRFITFEETPTWVSLSHCTNIAEKVSHTQGASWGGSTNIEAAFELIEQAIEQHRLVEEDIPSLIIFSDMQFDEAVGYGKQATQLRRIEERFARLGERLYGKPLTRPTIIFWNLRGDTEGFPATSSTSNVQMLSGFSPSLFKHVIDGTELEQEKKPNPYDTFRKAMDDERYDKVREVLSKSEEGYLSQYQVVRA